MENCSEEKEEKTEAILAFDTLYTTNHLKILKLLIPYLKSESQKKLAIYIKWQELVFTLDFFKHCAANHYCSDFKQNKKMDWDTLIPLLTPYCNESEKNIIVQFSQMQNMMNMMEQMQAYMPIIQQFMSSATGDGNINLSGMDWGENNLMDIFKNLMSEEQLSMFSSFMNESL